MQPREPTLLGKLAAVFCGVAPTSGETADTIDNAANSSVCDAAGDPGLRLVRWRCATKCMWTARASRNLEIRIELCPYDGLPAQR